MLQNSREIQEPHFIGGYLVASLAEDADEWDMPSMLIQLLRTAGSEDNEPRILTLNAEQRETVENVVDQYRFLFTSSIDNRLLRDIRKLFDT